MRGVQQLRQTLDDHAALAPDGAGLVEAAQAGAVRVRRRRRLALTGAVAAVTALAAALPATLPQLRDTAPHQAASAPTDYRERFQLTVDLAPHQNYFTLTSGTDGTLQFLAVRTVRPSETDQGGEVRVYDPGTYDPTQLLRGERITVQGHPAYYVPDLMVGTASRLEDPAEERAEREMRVPAVGWQDPSGAWVIVFGLADDRTALLRLAEQVRVGPPRDAVAPYHLTYVPAGLPGAYLQMYRGGPGGWPHSAVALAVDRQPSQDQVLPPLSPRGAPLKITMEPTEGNRDLEWIIPDLGPKTHTIAGYDAWYVPMPHRHFTGPEKGSQLFVTIGSCTLWITVADRTQIPFEEQKRMIEGAQFKDCENPDTWVKPLP
jgi:hypothetical protein